MQGIKEEITKMIFWNREAPIDTADRILKLIQFHLPKEQIYNPIDDSDREIHFKNGFNHCRKEIIKIINSICKE